MRIRDNGGACFTGRPARHVTEEGEPGFVRFSVPVLVLLKLLLERLVDDPVYHCLTDPPPGSGYSLPEAKDPALGMNPPEDLRKSRLGPVKLQPRLYQPDWIRDTGTDKP